MNSLGIVDFYLHLEWIVSWGWWDNIYITSCSLRIVFLNMSLYSEWVEMRLFSHSILYFVVWLYLHQLSETLSDIQSRYGRLLVGVRHILDFEQDGCNWLESDEVEKGVKTLARHGLTFDLLLRSVSSSQTLLRGYFWVYYDRVELIWPAIHPYLSCVYLMTLYNIVNFMVSGHRWSRAQLNW